MSIVPFYREQAAREKLSADGATLDNVRDRHRRAENAWTALADRLQHTDTLREARKTAQLVEETLNDPAERAIGNSAPATATETG